MKSIWKYPVTIRDDFELMMPEGAVILDVQMQEIVTPSGAYDEDPFMWAMVNPDAPQVQRRFAIYGTGFDLPDTVFAERYIGTFQSGWCVWHLFDVGSDV